MAVLSQIKFGEKIMFRFVTVLIAVLALVLAAPQGVAQLVATADLPDAPTPALAVSIGSSSSTSGILPVMSSFAASKSVVSIPKWEKVTHRGLQIAFPIALAADMITTYKNETHPYKVSYVATICTMTINGVSTHYPCQTNPIILDLTWARKDYHLFEEGGWAKFAGPRNAAATIGLNVGLDVLMYYADKKLWHKNNESLRRADMALIGWKTIGHLKCAIQNIRYVNRMEKWAIPGDEGATDIRWF